MPVAQPKPKAKKKLSTITNRLDKLVSLIVRLRDPACVTCGSTANPQCGHFISRVFVNIRWNLQNCHRQCSACNVSHELDPVPYTHFMMEKYGPEVLIELSQIAHSPKKLNRVDRLTIESDLKKLLSQMEEIHGVD